jgi:hypothetical protein
MDVISRMPPPRSSFRMSSSTLQNGRALTAPSIPSVKNNMIMAETTAPSGKLLSSLASISTSALLLTSRNTTSRVRDQRISRPTLVRHQY